MKLTSLLISILVFLMSGVMCLFSNSEVFAQVPQTKRGDQDSFLKNIRAKKRNNDLQKARQTKGKSYQKNRNKLRLRGVNAYKKKGGDNKQRHTSIAIFFNKIGFTYNYYSKKRIQRLEDDEISDKNIFDIEHKIINESISLSYLFGDTINFAIGISKDITRKEDGSIIRYYVAENSKNIQYTLKAKKSSSDFYTTYSIGLNIGFFEIVATAVQKNIKFKNYVCVNDDCPYNADQIAEESNFLNLEDTYFPFWYGIGIGFVF